MDLFSLSIPLSRLSSVAFPSEPIVVRISDNVLLESVELSPGRELLDGVFGFSTASLLGLLRVMERSERAGKLRGGETVVIIPRS